MAINVNVTLRRLIAELKGWADAHSMVEDFGYGDFLELYSEAKKTYPFLMVNCSNATSDKWYIKFSLEVGVGDWVYDGRSNYKRVESDMIEILRDFQNTVEESPRWQSFCKINGDITHRKFVEKGGDKFTGWGATINLWVKRRSGYCQLESIMPEYDFESGRVINPSCDSSTFKNSDGSFEVEIASGGEYTSEDVVNSINGVPQEAVPSNVGVNYPFICLDANVTVNDDDYGTVASGGSINVDVQDQDGDDSGELVGGIWVVPFSKKRIYVDPFWTGQTTSYADGDAYWRKVNGVGNIPSSGGSDQMRLQFGSQHLLVPDNVFGNKFNVTGVTGGYYDPSDGLYYDASGVLTTRELAFPDELGINHLIQRLVQMTQSGSRTWYDWCSHGLDLTIGDFSEFYLPLLSEMMYFGNWGIPIGYRDNDPFEWGGGLKLLSETYLGSGTSSAFDAEAYSHFRSTPKANSNKAILIKPIDIEATFG